MTVSLYDKFHVLRYFTCTGIYDTFGTRSRNGTDIACWKELVHVTARKNVSRSYVLTFAFYNH